LNPFFSKRSVTDLVPSITSLVNRLCDRLRDANKTGQPVNLKYCFAALTLDIINEYCFSTDPETTLKADFGEKEFDDIDSFLKMSLWVRLGTLQLKLYCDVWLRTFISPGLWSLHIPCR